MSSSSNVDRRVVEMELDSSKFQKNANVTMSVLDKLNEKLKFKDADKGIENLSKKASALDFSKMTSGIDELNSKFSAMGVAGMTVISNLTNRVVNAGARMARALAIAPVTQGFQEYELKLNSIQTIMNSSGASMKEVNKTLNELNTYADQTIYSFSDMTASIGKFTNAGVSLKDATKAIKGVANASAYAGASTAQANSAMYNISQSLSSGALQLIDYKSLELAGIATKKFREELIKTGIEEGTLVKKGKEAGKQMYESTTVSGQGKKSTFNVNNVRDSLQSRWATSDVVIKTLQKYTDTSTKLGKDATKAATQIKTITQLFDVLQEEAGSGWSSVWENIFGNFEESKKLWTEFGTQAQNAISSTFNSINSVLSGWKALGGRNDLIQSMRNSIEALSRIIKPISKAFKEIFPPVTAENIKRITQSIEDFTKSLQISKWEKVNGVWVKTNKNGERIYKVAKDVFASMRNILTFIKSIAKQASKAFKDVFSGVGLKNITKLTKAIRKFTEAFQITEWEKINGVWVKTNKNGEKIYKLFRGIFSVVKLVADTVGGVLASAFDLISTIFGKMTGNVKNSGGAVLDLAENIGDTLYNFSQWAKKNNVIIKGCKTLVKFLKQLINLLPEVDIKQAFGGIKSVLEVPLSHIAKILGPLKESLVGTFINAGKSIKQFFNDISTGKITIEDIPGLFLTFFDNIKTSFIQGGTDLKKNLLSLPSKVVENIKNFFINLGNDIKAFGENTDNPVLKAILSVFTFIGDSLKNIGENVLDSIAEAFDMLKRGKFFQGLVQGGALFSLLSFFKLIKKVIDLGEKIANPFESVMTKIGDSASAIAGSIVKLNKAKAAETYGEAVKSFAIAIVAIAAALFIISKIPEDRLESSIIVLGTIAAVLVIFLFVIRSLASAKLDSIKAAISVIGTLVPMAFAFVMLAIVFKIIETIDLSDPGKIAKVFGTLVTMVLAMLGLSWALGKFAKSNWNMSKVMKGLVDIGKALILMAASLWILSKIDAEDAIKGVILLEILVRDMIALLIVSAAAGSISSGATKGIQGIGIALILMAAAIYILGSIDPETAVKGVAALQILIYDIIKVLIASMAAGANGAAAISALKSLGLALILMAASIYILGSIDPETAVKGVGLMQILFMDIAAMIAATRVAGENSAKAAPSILAIGVTILLMSLSIAMLSAIQPAALTNATNAVKIISILLAALIGTSKVAGQNYKTIMMLGVVIGVMAIAVYILGTMDQAKLQNASLAVSMLTAVLAALIASTKLIPTSELGKTIAMLAVVIVVILAIVGIFAICQSLDTEKMIATALSISTVVISMIGMLAVLALLGKTGGAAISGAIQLIAVVVILGAAFAALGAFIEQNEGITELVKKAGDMMYAIGEALGKLIGGLASGVMSGLPDIGMYMSQFMMNATPFFVGLKMIDGDALNAVHSLLDIFMLLGAAELVNAVSNFAKGVLGFFSGGQTSSLKDAMGTIADALKEFVGKIREMKLDNAILRTASKAADVMETVVGIANALPKSGGLLQGIIGKNMGLGEFGKQLVDFAPNFVKFCTYIMPINKELMKSSLDVVKAVVEVAKNLPSTGGFLQGLIGEQSFSKFGAELMAFAPKFKYYCEQMKDVKTKDAEQSLGLIKKIIEVANSLPASGGFLQALTGEQSLADFGKDMVSMAGSFISFIGKIKDTSIDKSKLNDVFGVLEKAVAFSKTLPNSPTLLENWFGGGKQTLSSFVKELDDSADPLIEFYNKFNNQQINLTKGLSAFNGISTFVDSMKNLAAVNMKTITQSFRTFVNDILSIGSNNSYDAKTILSTIGSGLKDFASADDDGKLASLSTSIVNTSNGLKNILDLLGNNNRLSTIANSWKSLVTTIVDYLNKLKASFTGNNLTSLTTAINKYISTITSAFNNPSHKENMRKIGVNYVEGLRNGLADQSALKRVIDAAKEIAEKVKVTTKKTLKEKSPSKLSEEYGIFWNMGLANGLTDSGDTVVSASKSTLQRVIEATASAVGDVDKLMEDVNPVITPVVDLSGIQNGINNANTMFDRQLNLAGAYSSVNSISISNNRDTAANDVVKAIKSLESRFDNLEMNNYTVNGVTYDDGSNVANAVQSLIDAARIKRRM